MLNFRFQHTKFIKAGTLPLQAYHTEDLEKVLEVTENDDNIDFILFGLEDEYEEALDHEVDGNRTEKGYIDEPPELDSETSEEEDNNCGEEAHSDEPDDIRGGYIQFNQIRVTRSGSVGGFMQLNILCSKQVFKKKFCYDIY